MNATVSVLTGSRPRRRWIWIMVAVATTVVVVAPVGLRLWLKAAHHNQSLPVQVYRQQLTQLRVVAPSGGVTLVPSKLASVTVTGSLSWDFTRPSVKQAVRGRTLLVTGGCLDPGPFEDCQVGLTIQVPAHLDVEVLAGAGSISVRGLTGQLHLAVTSGSITLTRVSGPVSADAGSGSVSGSGVTSPVLDAVIGSGSLSLSFKAAPRDLNLAIGSGSASVTIPRGARLRTMTNSGGGTMNIAPGVADPSAAGMLTATLGTGVLSVGYAP